MTVRDLIERLGRERAGPSSMANGTRGTNGTDLGGSVLAHLRSGMDLATPGAVYHAARDHDIDMATVWAAVAVDDRFKAQIQADAREMLGQDRNLHDKARRQAQLNREARKTDPTICQDCDHKKRGHMKYGCRIKGCGCPKYYGITRGKK